MSQWGHCPLAPHPLFVEEHLFLLANMDVVIRVREPELVGEFLHALHILGTPQTHPTMQKGYHFLISEERPGKMRGNWIHSGADFKSKSVQK